MKTAHTVKRIPTFSISGLLLVVAGLAPLFGMALYPDMALIIAFGLAILWILLTRRQAQGGLGLLWGVKVEPAPCDVLFIWSWVKRFLNGQLQWPAYLALHLLAAFVLLNLLQMLWADSWQRGLWFAGATAYTISLCFYFSSSIPNLQAWEEMRKYYLGSVLVTALILILLTCIFFLGWAEGLSELYYTNRPKAFFKDPNVAGPFVVTGALFALSQLLFQRKRLISWFGVMFFLMVLATVLTFSRGALLNLIVGVLALGLIALWLRRGLRFTGLVPLANLLAISLLPYALDAFEQTLRFQGLTHYDIYGRFIAWQAGIQLFWDHPWGLGPGQFEQYSPAYQEAIAGPMLYLTPSSHNLYLRVLAENGILGFAVLLMALFSLIWISTKAVKLAAAHKGSLLLPDAAWLSSSLVGILAESLVIDTLHWRHLWILAGFILAYFKLAKETCRRSIS